MTEKLLNNGFLCSTTAVPVCGLTDRQLAEAVAKASRRAEAKTPYKLNVGCGRDIRPGWLNLDRQHGPGVDLVADLEAVRDKPIDLPDNSVGEFLLRDVLEHVRNLLPLMEELWRLAVPNAFATVHVPHGGSDAAWEDPTHVRAFYPGSFGYFSQPYYWRADYGYRGDWQPEEIVLALMLRGDTTLTDAQVCELSHYERNVVGKVLCQLVAIKPVRPADRALMRMPVWQVQR